MCFKCGGSGWLKCPECFGDGHRCTFCYGKGEVRCPRCSRTESALGKGAKKIKSNSWQRTVGNLPNSAFLQKPMSFSEKLRKAYKEAAQYRTSKKQNPVPPDKIDYVISCRWCGNKRDLTDWLIKQVAEKWGVTPSVEAINKPFFMEKLYCSKCLKKGAKIKIKVKV